MWSSGRWDLVKIAPGLSGRPVCREETHCWSCQHVTASRQRWAVDWMSPQHDTTSNLLLQSHHQQYYGFQLRALYDPSSFDNKKWNLIVITMQFVREAAWKDDWCADGVINTRQICRGRCRPAVHHARTFVLSDTCLCLFLTRYPSVYDISLAGLGASSIVIDRCAKFGFQWLSFIRLATSPQ